MEDATLINQDINVVAYYFKGKDQPKCFPKRIEYKGRQITFTETGLRHPTTKGRRMVHIFDMTDGQADYRLEFDATSLGWKLVYIADMAYAALRA
jgi:hypothetical protein